MIVYRLSHEKYASSLSSSGASNRWNKMFQFVIYCSENISLCALELLAHTNGVRPAGGFKIIKIEISNSAKTLAIEESQLLGNWNQLSCYPQTQQIGSHWYESKSSLCMKVPSALIPTEFNYVINTHHQDYTKKVKLIDTKDFFWDNRFPSN